MGILTRVLFKTQKASEGRHQELNAYSSTLSQTSTDLTEECQRLRAELIQTSNELRALEKRMAQKDAQVAEHVKNLDAIRKSFGGYFEIARKNTESIDSRLKVVEMQTEQVIRVGKGIAARTRGKAEDDTDGG